MLVSRSTIGEPSGISPIHQPMMPGARRMSFRPATRSIRRSLMRSAESPERLISNWLLLES